MSRIGKKPIPLPSGVKVTVGEQLQVTGPKGTLSVPIPAGITVEQAAGKLELKRSGDELAALHGARLIIDTVGAVFEKRKRPDFFF